MKNAFAKIPSIEKVIQHSDFKNLIKKYGRDIVIKALRNIFNDYRQQKVNLDDISDYAKFAKLTESFLKTKINGTLVPMINATGIILHTNLGRAPMGKYVLSEIEKIALGYSNLEFDLQKGKRGNRNSHIKNLITEITNSEDAVVVNNNAAAVMLTLKTFAENREVIISRGELIEIGGSFRIPDIMEASGAKMVEVGATNRTKLCDYEKAITPNTKIIFKAHKSNYFIGGFTEEVLIKDLADLAHKHNLIMIYDLGSGLLRKPETLPVEDEPDVKFSIDSGADIVTFSGDKLLGGAQAGIIIGKEKYISQIFNHPMMRALRVGKLTLASLNAVLKSYLDNELLIKNIPLFEMLSRKNADLKKLAKQFKKILGKNNISSEIIENNASCGGGTLPHLKIKSFAVKLILPKEIKASELHHELLQTDTPVLSILKKGEILFDVLTLQKMHFPIIAKMLNNILRK